MLNEARSWLDIYSAQLSCTFIELYTLVSAATYHASFLFYISPFVVITNYILQNQGSCCGE